MCDMPKYLLLIYGDEQKWEAMSPQDHQRLDDGHLAFRAAAGRGVLGGHELELTSVATTLRTDPAGTFTITDGPFTQTTFTQTTFTQTTDALGGYYLLEAADLDEAVALAAHLHEVSAGHSAVEIRPVVERG
jgi:hypothetical protein